MSFPLGKISQGPLLTKIVSFQSSEVSKAIKSKLCSFQRLTVSGFRFFLSGSGSRFKNFQIGGFGYGFDFSGSGFGFKNFPIGFRIRVRVPGSGSNPKPLDAGSFCELPAW